MATRPAVAGDLAAERVGAGLDELVPLDALEALASAQCRCRLAPQGVAAKSAASEDCPLERVGVGTHEFVPLDALEALEVESPGRRLAISRTPALRGPWAAAVLVALGAAPDRSGTPPWVCG